MDIKTMHIQLDDVILFPDGRIDKAILGCKVYRVYINIYIYEVLAYRIRNCFSTISTKILVNRFYFAICGEFLSANFCESPIFSPYTVIYLLFQLSWLLVPCLTINFGDFLCDLFVELPKFSQILVTSTVIIFVFLPVLLPNLVIISKH